MPLVRYFAGAAEAAGTEAEQLVARTVGELRAVMIAAHGDELGQVLTRCSVLVDGVRSDDGASIAPSDVVDVLPPFAGG
ncbi:MAG: MoaD/ThiS family protein [Cellulomonas sp.]